MDELPAALLAPVPEAARPAVVAWWAGLAPDERAAVAARCDERWEACFFGPAHDPPVVHGGRFVPSDDAWRYADWEADWREYLSDNPDVVIAARFQSRCFRTGDGQVCVWVDWSRTRFSPAEVPPSERRRAEPGAAPDG